VIGGCNYILFEQSIDFFGKAAPFWKSGVSSDSTKVKEIANCAHRLGHSKWKLFFSPKAKTVSHMMMFTENDREMAGKKV
jgi:hypothetical protein